NCFEQIITSANDPYYFLKDLGKLIFGSIFAFFVRRVVIKICKIWPKNLISIFEHSLIGNFITSSVRYDIPYSDNYFLCCGKINDYLMTEIWKNRLCKNVDIYKRNFRYNLAKNGHIDVGITVLSS
ncbi:hypothetical protein, partial [Shigella flexneri]|uniref:hypothetical protein n=1 Tax=Shigella flexneri TaxID=623 RepID=UPI001C0A7139